MEVTLAAIEGVGDLEAGDRTEDGRIAFHRRRALTDDEARKLAGIDVRPPFWTA